MTALRWLLRRKGGVWRVAGCSVRGAEHQRRSVPNQDAIGWLPHSASGPPVVAAVSDGHGDVRCFRSDAGARLAVQAALAVLQGALAGRDGIVSEERMRGLGGAIIDRWIQLVRDDLARRPITSAELDGVRSAAGERAAGSIEANPTVAYGATLLAAAVTESHIACAQVGDGDILFVAPTGATTRAIPRDERFRPHETASLCIPDALDHVRVRVEPRDAGSIDLIVISTDGYSNSFASERDYFKVGRDYLDMIRREGVDRVAGQLEEILTDATRRGSGDDITVALVAQAS